MTTNQKKLTNMLLVLFCLLSAQMVVPQLLLAENHMTLTAVPTEVPADGSSPSLITATVDTDGLVEPGVELKFTTTHGVFSNGSAAITKKSDASGKSIEPLTSTSTGSATVTCKSAGGFILVVVVKFTVAPQLPPTLTSFVLSVDPPAVPADDLSSSEVSAQLYDQFGKPLALPGVTVNFTTTPGGPAHFANNRQTIAVSTDENGTATVLVYSPVPGVASVDATIGSLNADEVFVNFTGAGYPALIFLSASSSWIPADRYSTTAITAFILDSDGQPVAAGTMVTFTTTASGVFENGQTTFSMISTDDTGTVTVYLKAASASTGTATITCSAGGTASQSLEIEILRLEYETEPNNDMAQADEICFNNMFLSQLFSPYEEDWYTFTIRTPSRIGINFMTTAIPEIAGDCKDSTTVGTYRVDIRDKNNNVLMSYQNVDCSLDNGRWETGVVPSGTYYVVVFCPRLPDNSHYLSSPYYMRVFNQFYFPCGNSDKLLNAAALYQESSDYQLRVPIIDPAPYFWADLQYDPFQGTGLMFRLNDFGVLQNLDDYRSCNLPTLVLENSGNYVLHIPVLIFDGVSYRVDLTHVPTTDGLIWFMLSGAWFN